jgi:hypothetical protein
MNAGMFDASYAPQSLFIQERRTIKPLDVKAGQGNFYLKPNGVFYLTTDGAARICKTEDFLNPRQVTYATQSGPLLVIDGNIHPGPSSRARPTYKFVMASACCPVIVCCLRCPRARLTFTNSPIISREPVAATPCTSTDSYRGPTPPPKKGRNWTVILA